MNEQMDMQKKWIFEDISTEAKLEHRRRTAIEDAVKRGDIDEKAWEEEQEIIEKLWLQIKELKENETKMMEQECREVEETTDATVYDSEDNEEEDAKVAENEVIHATRASYLKWKPPITSFNEDAFLELPEDKQQILLEHNDEIFGKDVLYQEQIEKVVLLIYDPTRGSCSGCKNIADLFGISRGAMQTHITRLFAKQKNEMIGRPSILNEEHLMLIGHHVESKMEGSKSPDFPALQNWIYKNFNIDLSVNTLIKIIDRSQTMKSCIGLPMEQARAEVPLEVIIDYYDRLSRYLEALNIPPCFMFNVDESGFQEFVDAVPVPVIVPIDYNDDTVAVSVNRNKKRASMIGCISADGSALKPMIVTSRKRITTSLKA